MHSISTLVTGLQAQFPLKVDNEGETDPTDAPVEKHFHDGSPEPQIPRLRSG
jgi:hypothetical protein